MQDLDIYKYMYATSFVEPWTPLFEREQNNNSVDINNIKEKLSECKKSFYFNLFSSPIKPIDKTRINAFMLWQLYHQYHKTYGEFQNIALSLTSMQK